MIITTFTSKHIKMKWKFLNFLKQTHIMVLEMIKVVSKVSLAHFLKIFQKMKIKIHQNFEMLNLHVMA